MARLVLERNLKDVAERLIEQGNRAEREGRLQEARDCYRQAVEAAPDYAKAHINLGIALEALGDSTGAAQSHRSALRADPLDPYANYNLGRLLYGRGELEEAQRRLEDALKARPDFADAQVVLGCTLRALGKPEAASTALGAALRVRPADINALFHYAAALRELDRLAEAQRALEQVVELDPRALEARAALSDVLQARGNLDGAARVLQTLLQEKPDWVDALYNYGATLLTLGRDAEAEDALRQVLARDPSYGSAYRMLGNLLHREGRVSELIELFGRALARHPGQWDIESFQLFLLNFSDRVTDAELFERHRDFGRRLEKAQPPRFSFAPQPRDAERALRIGFLSGELYYHPVGLFLLPVLERLDRARLSTHCYSIGTKQDAFTGKLKAAAAAWHDASSLSDAQLADAIHGDGIDILIDLAGHSGIPRLPCLAMQPAPVQASWLGYLNTTGLTRVAYRIVDGMTDPPGAERWHTERLLRLPAVQWCYRPFISTSPAPRPPCASSGRVTFGSFTQVAKLSDTTLSRWGDILARLPEAQLIIVGAPKARGSDLLLERLRAAGIDAGRCRLVPFVPLQQYFEWFNAVDIALDPTPYSGGTTTCDALWMGVPVLTCAGSRPVSRSAASILTAVGLTDWIAATGEEYVGIAVRFAKDLEMLAKLRATLRARMQSSALMDESRFARDLEALLREMWRRWCAQGE